MKVLGLFKEFYGMADSAPSIHDYVKKLDKLYKDSVLDYLTNQGIAFFDYMDAPADPLDKNVHNSGGSSLITDGYYIWRQDLAYFVERYDLSLPMSFVEHVLNDEKASPDTEKTSNNWQNMLQIVNMAYKGDADVVEY